MKIPYLGELLLHWCMRCNLPVLGEKCGICGGETKKVEITPPGDVRPAFQGDVQLINETIEKQFGCELLPRDKLVVLNKTSGYDRFDEVILDGEVVGALKYSVAKTRFEFLPRMEGARRIFALSKRKFVEVSEDAKKFILHGASVLMPGVVNFDESIERDEEVIVTCGGEVLGVGRSRFSGAEAKGLKKGMFVKLRKCEEPREVRILEGGQKWKDVIEANEEILASYEAEAVEFTKKVANEKRLPVAVAFSGGKDSLVTLLLVRKAIGDVDIIFIDTGIEFPETKKFVREFAKKNNLRLIEGGAASNFWRGVAYFGAPGRDYRWCCKISKLGPTAQVIKRRYPRGCLNFVGQRSYESQIRARSKRMWRNPWLPIQLAASPIQHWTALHVWLYLMREGVEANELYSRGMERIGCWACPASELVDLEITRRIHPNFIAALEKKLRKSGASESEIKLGFWRWRKPGRAQRRLAKELGLEARERSAKEFSYEVAADGNALKVSGTFESNDFERMKSLAKIWDGKINGDELILDGAIVARDGKFSFTASDRKDAEEKARFLFGIAERAAHCFGCGTCLAQCKYEAIELRDGKAWITSACKHCKLCHERCPIVRYAIGNAKLKAAGSDEPAV